MWRDHLRDHPDEGEAANRAGAALNRWVGASLATSDAAGRGAAFAALCRGVAVAVWRGDPLPAGRNEDWTGAMALLGRLGAFL